MRSSNPSKGSISWCCRLAVATVALGLTLVLGFVPSGFAQSVNGPLNFENNFFVTGDYVVAGAQGMNSNFSNGFTTGTITVPDTNQGIQPGSTANCQIKNSKGVLTNATNCVPAGAEILAALLYWQTVEKTGQSGSGQNGFFGLKGGTAYPISGVDLMSQSTVSFSGGGCTGGSTGKVVRTYRAPVIGYLPQDPNTGTVLANNSYQVTLPSVGSSGPLTLGASLVIIYRIISPTVPLNSIVIYDGAYGQSNTALTMQQTMQGFYDAAANPVARLTEIVGSGQSNKYQTVYLGANGQQPTALASLYGKNAPAFPGSYGGSSGYGWDNPTWTFPNGLPGLAGSGPVGIPASVTTKVVPSGSNQGCVSWGAVIFSTTVQNTDGDTLLDLWKTNQGYCDASFNEGVCSTSDMNHWVPLPGAATPGHGVKDVFVQLDYTCSSITNGACNTGPGSYSFNPVQPPNPNPLDPVVAAFSSQGINLHIIPGNAISETLANPQASSLTCTDDNTTSPPTLCPNPGQPGVVGWKGGLIFIQNQLIDPSTGNFCTTNFSPADCVSVLEPAKKDSYHYALFAHGIGLPTWSLGAGNLKSVVQSGTTVTFTTTTPVGALNPITIAFDANKNPITMQDPTCTLHKLGRVTVAYAISNPSLNGTFCVQSVTANSFSITVANSTSKATPYTFITDPDLEVGNGFANTVSGFSDVGGQDSLITLGNWGADATPQVKTGTFMHELGHSLGLTHGGFYYDVFGLNPPHNYTPTIEPNCKPNHQSVMNYMFQIDLLDNGTGTNVPDYSQQSLDPLDKLVAQGSDPFSTHTPFYQSTGWHGTAAQLAAHTPPIAVGANAKTLPTYCDGTPLPAVNPNVYRVTQPFGSLTWLAGQDINFDGNTTTEASLRGYDDWSPSGTLTTGVDMRQIGATGSLSAAGLVGGGKQFGGGGGKQFGGGGGQQFGAGGGKQFGGGGGKQFGGGGGKQFGGGGGLGEITQSIANSFTRPPRNLTATEAPSARTITLKWFSPTFGAIVSYNIYESIAGGPFNPLVSVPGVPGAPPGTAYSSPAINVSCNSAGYSFEVTAVILNGNPPAPQESIPSNTVSTSGQTGVLLTGCYTNNPPADVINSLSVPNTQFVQGVGTVPITWSLQDDDTSAVVNNTFANTLTAYGPFASDQGCPASLPANPGAGISLLSNGIVKTLPSTFGFSGGGFTYNWDTTNFNAGCYFFKLSLDSGQSQTTSTALTLLIFVSDGNPHVITTKVPTAVVGSTYPNVSAATLQEAGGTGGITWSVVVPGTGSLPTGISLSPSGTLTGTTCQKGNFNFTARAMDSLNNFGTQNLMLTVLPAPVAQVNQPTAPESSVPGGAAVALTVNGTGFNACSSVVWNGTSFTPTSQSATELTATIPNSKVATAGTASISVANTGSPTSNVDFFQITNSTGSTVFLSPAAAATSVGAGSKPNGVVSGDFNGDGIQDLAVANFGTNNVSVLLGSGDGTFNSAIYPAGIGATALAVGDFNNDGKLDLAVANVGDNTVSILLGKGDGTFPTSVPYGAGSGPTSVVTGDFNGDGALDLAVADSGSNTVSILLGKGDGTFQTATTYPAGSGPLSVVSGDFNRDGKLDLAVTNPGAGQVSVLLGNGDGTFQAPVSYNTEAGGNALALTAADFTGTGILDLAVTSVNANSNNANTVSVFLGKGDGTFTLNASYPATMGLSNSPTAITSGDFNGDGIVDLAITDTADNSVSILVGNGDGSFQSPLEYQVGNSAAGVAAGDFNGDGRLDAAVANTTDGTVSIMLQAPRVQLTPSPLAFSTGVTVGSTSAPQVVTLTNTGSAALTTNSIAIGGANSSDFSKTNTTCPPSTSTLAAGASCTITITFSPTATGARTATLTFTDNAFDSPQNVTINGTGLPVAPSGLASPNQTSTSVSLTWNASPTAGVVGYNVYQATASGGPYTKLTAVPTPNLNFTDTTVNGGPNGTTYYYVVTAVDGASPVDESGNSAELAVAVPPPAP